MIVLKFKIDEVVDGNPGGKLGIPLLVPLVVLLWCWDEVFIWWLTLVTICCCEVGFDKFWGDWEELYIFCNFDSDSNISVKAFCVSWKGSNPKSSSAYKSSLESTTVVDIMSVDDHPKIGENFH